LEFIELRPSSQSVLPNADGLPLGSVGGRRLAAVGQRLFGVAVLRCGCGGSLFVAAFLGMAVGGGGMGILTAKIVGKFGLIVGVNLGVIAGAGNGYIGQPLVD
jgi:hypothetical protein